MKTAETSGGGRRYLNRHIYLKLAGKMAAVILETVVLETVQYIECRVIWWCRKILKQAHVFKDG